MKGVIFLTLTMALVAAACTPKQPQSKNSSEASSQTPRSVRIVSFTIEPSRQQDGWLMYKPGATAVLKAENISAAAVRYLSTGTGVGLEHPDGKLLGDLKKHADGSYRLALPAGLMTTNFWVEVKDKDGKVVRGPDLGNVADESAK